MAALIYKTAKPYQEENNDKNISPLESLLDNVQVDQITCDIYRINYSNIISVYLYQKQKELSQQEQEQILRNALYLLYMPNDKYTSSEYLTPNDFSLESMLPSIERVPDGSLGGGFDGYTHWTILGVFIPSQNKIKLVNSAGERVLNHELGHWYAHWMGIPQPTREVAEELAERHKYDGRNLFDRIRNNDLKTKYLKAA